MEQNNISVNVESSTGTEALTFPARRLICAGWVGRDNLQAHIDELAEHGVPGPSRLPIYMNFSLDLISFSDIVDVVSEESSGGIIEYGKRLRNHQITCEQATEAYLARIRALDPKLQATQPGSLFGQCGISSPIRTYGSDLPVGLQVLCPAQDIEAAIAIGLAIEQVTGPPPMPDVTAFLQ